MEDVNRSEKATVLLILMYFIFSIFGQVARLLAPVDNFYWINALCQIIAYSILALLIFVERERLNDSHIDKLSLFIVFLFGFVLHATYPSRLLLDCSRLIVLLFIAGWLFTRLRSSQVQVTSAPKVSLWILIAVVISFGWGIFLFLLTTSPSVLPETSSTIPVLGGYFLYHLTNAAITEEAIFRGFLWGYLRRRGLSDKRVLFLQAAVFTLFHIYNLITTPFYTWIIGLLGGVFFGYLAWKSRSVAPGMLAHALINAFTSLAQIY